MIVRKLVFIMFLFQLCLKSQHDAVLVISYVLYNNFTCSYTVRDDLDPESMEMVPKRVLEFESIVEFEDVIQYCILMQIHYY